MTAPNALALLQQIDPMLAAQQVRPEQVVAGQLLDALSNLFLKATPPPSVDTSMAPTMAQVDAAAVGTGPGAVDFQLLTKALMIAQDRRNLHAEYDEIEQAFPEIGTALDVFADNCCATDSFSEDIVTIVTDDDTVGALFIVFKQILQLDAKLWSRARQIAGRGEYFDEFVVSADTMFVSRLKPLPTPMMQRNEDEYGLLPVQNAFSQLKEDYKSLVNFGQWQIVHWRLLKNPDDIYGVGLMYGIRALAKRLALSEDALTLGRLHRAVTRTVFGVPVDDMDPDMRKKAVMDVKREFRKRRIVNPRTQKLDLEQHPLSEEADIFIGQTKESSMSVQQLQGDMSISQLADIEYFQNKMFAGLQIPKAYAGLERDVNSKATLTEQDVQFARTVHRIQMVLQTGIREMFDRALILYGIDPSTVEYTLAFPAISLIDELRNWEIENLKLQCAMQFADLIRPSDEWLLREYLGFSQEEVNEILADQKPMPVDDLDAGAGGGGTDSGNGQRTSNRPSGTDMGESRREQLESLFDKGRTLKVMALRAQRRENAAMQQKDRRKLAAEMSRYRNVARGRR